MKRISLWTTGYGSLENVLFAGDFATELRVDLAADEGFEVGLSGFDLAAFSSNQEIQGIEVLDGSSSVVWAVGVTEISGTSFNAFDTSGVFASSLSIRVDLTGQGTNADNFGIDNIQVSQRSVAAVPEPAAASAILLGSLLLFARRRKF